MHSELVCAARLLLRDCDEDMGDAAGVVDTAATRLPQTIATTAATTAANTATNADTDAATAAAHCRRRLQPHDPAHPITPPRTATPSHQHTRTPMRTGTHAGTHRCTATRTRPHTPTQTNTTHAGTTRNTIDGAPHQPRPRHAHRRKPVFFTGCVQLPPQEDPDDGRRGHADHG